MNVEQFREYLIRIDQETLEQRVKRGMELPPSAYNQTLPQLIWNYVTSTRQMFIDEHFIGVILLCAGMVELCLADQIMSRIKMTRKEIERYSLDQMTSLAHRLEIVTDQEKVKIDKLRKLRNALIHPDAGKIAKMVGKRLSDIPKSSEWSDIILAELYSTSLFGEEGISGDAKRHFLFVRDLTLRFYGAES